MPVARGGALGAGGGTRRRLPARPTTTTSRRGGDRRRARGARRQGRVLHGRTGARIRIEEHILNDSIPRAALRRTQGRARVRAPGARGAQAGEAGGEGGEELIGRPPTPSPAKPSPRSRPPTTARPPRPRRRSRATYWSLEPTRRRRRRRRRAATVATRRWPPTCYWVMRYYNGGTRRGGDLEGQLLALLNNLNLPKTDKALGQWEAKLREWSPPRGRSSRRGAPMRCQRPGAALLAAGGTRPRRQGRAWARARAAAARRRRRGGGGGRRSGRLRQQSEGDGDP